MALVSRGPICQEELRRALPPPSRTLNLSGAQVIGILIEAEGRPLSLAAVHERAQGHGLDFEEAALRRCAERPDSFLRPLDGDRWTVDADDPRMQAARSRVRQLIQLNAEKKARDREHAERMERFRAEEAAKAQAAARLGRKLAWRGRVIAVQPRIRLTRSFDQRDHSYLGYMLRVVGSLDDRQAEFTVGIGEAAQAKHGFRVGDEVEGTSLPVEEQRAEPVEYYKTSGLKLIARAPKDQETAPPWRGLAPELAVYRERGHRRLDSKTYDNRCSSCIWGCRMPVVMIVDHWNPSRKRYRFETFCCGPKDCSFYRSGPTRKVPGRRGMSWEEEDWVDEQETSGRGPSE